MKRALNVSDEDHLNFFRLYDGCLMDMAVLAWCKLFGSHKTEDLHWRKLFPDAAVVRCKLEKELQAAVLDQADVSDLDALSVKLRCYRDTSVAHHDLNLEKRPSHYPQLDPLRETGLIVYREIHAALQMCGRAEGLTDPAIFQGEKLKQIEEHWSEISSAAREATLSFRDSKP